MVAQALSKKAGVEFSIADISGDDLMSQREALATQGVKVIPPKETFITNIVIPNYWGYYLHHQSSPSS